MWFFNQLVYIPLLPHYPNKQLSWSMYNMERQHQKQTLLFMSQQSSLFVLYRLLSKTSTLTRTLATYIHSWYQNMDMQIGYYSISARWIILSAPYIHHVLQAVAMETWIQTSSKEFIFYQVAMQTWTQTLNKKFNQPPTGPWSRLRVFAIVVIYAGM